MIYCFDISLTLSRSKGHSQGVFTWEAGQEQINFMRGELLYGRDGLDYFSYTRHPLHLDQYHKNWLQKISHCFTCKDIYQERIWGRPPFKNKEIFLANCPHLKTESKKNIFLSRFKGSYTKYKMQKMHSNSLNSIVNFENQPLSHFQ